MRKRRRRIDTLARKRDGKNCCTTSHRGYPLRPTLRDQLDFNLNLSLAMIQAKNEVCNAIDSELNGKCD